MSIQVKLLFKQKTNQSNNQYNIN